LPSWSRCDLDRQRVESRGEERLADAFQPGQQHEDPERRAASEHCRGERPLRSAAERVRGEHHPAPAEPVGDRAGHGEQAHLGDHAGREHDAQAGSAHPPLLSQGPSSGRG
jgi:hypothetical protein